MLIPMSPNCENTRLKTLHSLEVLDTEAKAPFEDVVHLATFITGCPVAFVSLVDKDRQWFMARRGVEINETPRELTEDQKNLLESLARRVINDKIGKRAQH